MFGGLVAGYGLSMPKIGRVNKQPISGAAEVPKIFEPGMLRKIR
jgi:hypothetical protein